MKTMLRVLALAATTALAVATVASAADFPTKSIKIIVGSTPGATPDVVARITAEALAADFKQPVIVENRAGVGSLVGIQFVAKAPADGYTLMLMGSPLVTLPIYTKDVGVDPLKDFTPVSLIVDSPYTLVSNPAAGGATLREVAAHIKANPGKSNYATTGAGDPPLMFELLKRQAGLQMTHIPYSGGAQTLAAVLSGECQLAWSNLFGPLQLRKEGKMHVLAVSGRSRVRELPDVPTMGEAGFPGYEDVSNWAGMVAPAGTPPAVVKLLSDAIARAAKRPDVAEKFRKLGFEPVASSPAELGRVMASLLKSWTDIAQSAGIKPQ